MTNPAATQNKEIDCLSPEAQKLAEARLAAKRAARAEAREIRMKELERQQKEEDSERCSRRSRRNTSASDEDERMSVGSRGSLRVEERPEKDFTEKGSRSLAGLSAATLASLGGTSSRRGSGDTSISIDTEASIREIKDSLAEVEEKYKKAMVSNAQLDNEKMNYMYQVDTLKDTLLELEEQLAESRRQYEEKSKEFEREKHTHSLLQFQFAQVKAALQQREEMLEKHGIILNSETATNGETSDTLNSVGYPGPTKMTKEELNALKATGDGTLGKATAVEVKNEIVEKVGKREILQNTEQEQHKEEPVQDCVDTEVLPPGDTAEKRKASEDSAPSRGTLATNEGQVQSPGLESTSFLEHAEQVESRELTSTPDAKSSSEPDGETLGPVIGQGSRNALDIKNQSEEAAEKQEQEEQAFQTSLGEVSTKPHQEPAPVQIPEVEKESSFQGAVEAGLAGLEEQAGTVASRPPRYSNDTVNHVTCAVDVPKELGPRSEKELTNQEGAEPREVPVPSTGAAGEHSEEEDEGRGFLSEKPVQTEVPASPSSPEASAQEAAGTHTVKAKREPSEEKNDPQGEGLDSSPKKTKNKKRKNKKKKSPAPVETPQDVKEELTFQNPDLSEVKEEKQVNSPDEKSGVDTQNEVTGNHKQNTVAGSSESPGFPEDPKMELVGKLNHEDGDVNTEVGKGRADGEPLLLEGDTIQASGSRASAEASEEGAAKTNTEGAGAAPSRPPENEEVPGSARLGSESPSEDINAASQTEGTEGCVVSECPSQSVRKVLGSISLENDDSAPTGESGDSHSECKEETRGRSEKDKSKEDCALS
uniref:LRR binding FLII interacting protein 1 n=1 Tax=Pipistrellus kuhlii TaxID=59472 RepID=A0A7J7XVF3_PIPKU|nr:LRR binding FLII interacting protein 1 [Pipistrellus kuhlii]